MEDRVPEMVDMVFGLKGRLVGEDYAYALWDEVARFLPALDDAELVGILPLRVAPSNEGMLLSQRAKLVLRLPAAWSSQASGLCGQELIIGSEVLRVGAATLRHLKPFTTLHAQLVEGAEDEATFLDGVAASLQLLGVSCKWICGRGQTVSGVGSTLSGYSLVLYDLKPDESIKIQSIGLGGKRRFGCGIFVPYKEISGLG